MPVTAINNQAKPCGLRAPRRHKPATAAIPRSLSPSILLSLRPHTFAKLGPARCNLACSSQAWEACSTARAKACILLIRLRVSICPKLRQVRSRPRNKLGLANIHSPNNGGHSSSNKKTARVTILNWPSFGLRTLCSSKYEMLLRCLFLLLAAAAFRVPFWFEELASSLGSFFLLSSSGTELLQYSRYPSIQVGWSGFLLFLGQRLVLFGNDVQHLIWARIKESGGRSVGCTFYLLFFVSPLLFFPLLLSLTIFHPLLLLTWLVVLQEPPMPFTSFGYDC
jgi:hypothetical protein